MGVDRPSEDHPPVRRAEQLRPAGSERLFDGGGLVGKWLDRVRGGHASSAKSWCGSSRYDLTFATNCAPSNPSTTRWSSEIERFIMSAGPIDPSGRETGRRWI